MEIVLSWALFLVLVIMLFSLLRNEVTFRVRLKFIDANFDLYNLLPDYYSIVFSCKYFLIWTESQWLAWVRRRREICAA